MEGTKRFRTPKMIALGYLIVILVGTLLLLLPFATKENQYAIEGPLQRIFNSVFTATSATCVTGLSIVNVGEYWSIFGQVVILIMIQSGGLGFMVIVYLFAMVFRRKITLHERKNIMQSVGSLGIGGIVNLIRKIFLFSLVFELAGALILAIKLIPEYGTGKGLYYSLFLSVSAFCNAGFDPLGAASLEAYKEGILVPMTIAALIISGGLGFVVWFDLFENRCNWKKLNLHTKIVLVTSFALIFAPTVLIFIFEHNNAFVGLSFDQKLRAAFFQAVTCRTAGFATISQASLSDPTVALSIILMLIGGSSGSTAGGIKTTTFAVLVLSVLSTTRKKQNVVVGSKQLDPSLTKNASAIFISYLFMVNLALLIILGIEQTNDFVGFRDCMFEVVSAVGTVGLSSASTANFHHVTQVILIFLMYAGRLGALVIIAIFREKSESESDILQRPTEKIVIG